MTDRAQYDGGELDEVVAENVGIHIEALDSHNWMLMFTRPATDGKPAVYAHFTVRDLVRCLQCVESGTGTARECDKAAEKHVKQSGHGTLTGTQPRGNK